MCVGAILLRGWSKHSRLGMAEVWEADRRGRFGFEEAPKACSLEVRWQTKIKDIKRYPRRVVLLVSGIWMATQIYRVVTLEIHYCLSASKGSRSAL